MMPLVNSLEEVRVNIDRIDAMIIRLMAERQLYVKEAARFKNSADEVKAPARVEAVISKVKTLAIQHGLDEKIAEAVYRTMINGFIQKEQEQFNKTNK
jgi:isochorismate pyruvate lyase